jgi:hypothetical protein
MDANTMGELGGSATRAGAEIGFRQLMRRSSHIAAGFAFSPLGNRHDESFDEDFNVSKTVQEANVGTITEVPCQVDPCSDLKRSMTKSETFQRVIAPKLQQDCESFKKRPVWTYFLIRFFKTAKGDSSKRRSSQEQSCSFLLIPHRGQRPLHSLRHR